MIKKIKKITLILVILNFSIFSLYSQNKTIKGRVITDDFETESFVLIKINDTLEIGKTDMEGYFQISIPISVKKLSFLDIGLDRTIIELTDTCNEIEVIMMLTGTDCFMTLKKSDRLRMRRFKKLPELHKIAFEKGLFKTNAACYKQVFIPYYKKKIKNEF